MIFNQKIAILAVLRKSQTQTEQSAYITFLMNSDIYRKIQ